MSTKSTLTAYDRALDKAPITAPPQEPEPDDESIFEDFGFWSWYYSDPDDLSLI